MAEIGLTNSSNYEEIANAIRKANKTNNLYTPAEMAAAIELLSSVEEDPAAIRFINVSNTDNTSILDFMLEDGTNQTIVIAYDFNGNPAGIALNDDFTEVEWMVE